MRKYTLLYERKIYIVCFYCHIQQSDRKKNLLASSNFAKKSFSTSEQTIRKYPVIIGSMLRNNTSIIFFWNDYNMLDFLGVSYMGLNPKILLSNFVLITDYQLASTNNQYHNTILGKFAYITASKFKPILLGQSPCIVSTKNESYCRSHVFCR